MKQLLKKENVPMFAITALFILLGITLRLVPHVPNFTPITAIALFGGFYFSRKIALFLPLLVLVASDAFIGFYDLKIMLAVYGSFLLTVLLGFWLKKKKKWHTVWGFAFLSAVLFFIITNFAVWAFSSWYPRTFGGLVQCYVMGLPFFKSTLLSSLFYSGVLFGGFSFVQKLAVASRRFVLTMNYFDTY